MQVLLGAIVVLSCWASDDAPLSLPIYTITAPIELHLIPSLHISTDAAYRKLSSEVLALMHADGYLYLEYDILSHSSADINPLATYNYISSSDEKQRRKAVVGESFSRFMQAHGQVGTIDDVLSLHPYLLLTALEANCFSNNANLPMSIDLLLRDAAVTRKLNIRSLETIAESFVSVVKIPASDWDLMLQSALLSIENGTCRNYARDFKKSVKEALMVADIEKVLSVVEAYHQKVYGSRVLLDAYISIERNLNQLKKIEAATRQAASSEAPPLFVIGAAHFAGHRGLLELMCRSGWTVRGSFKNNPIASCN